MSQTYFFELSEISACGYGSKRFCNDSLHRFRIQCGDLLGVK